MPPRKPRRRLRILLLLGLVVLLKHVRRRRSLTLDPCVPLCAARNMPAELLARSFDDLGFWDLVRASHVCRYWRHAARNHPRYWGDISIESITKPVAWWAMERMELVDDSDTRRFRLAVDFPGERALADTMLLDLICWRISRVRDLRLTMCSTYLVGIWQALCNPMPYLERLDLTIEIAPFASFDEVLWFPMPINVLGGAAPALRRVLLHNVALPAFTADSNVTIASFSAVESVSFSCDTNVGQSFPTFLFSIFPSMRRLTLSAGLISFADRPSESLQAAWSALEYSELCFPHNSSLILFHALPTDSIRTVLVQFPTEELVAAAMRPMLGPLHLEITDMDNELRFAVRSQTGLIRDFADAHDKYPINYDGAPARNWVPLLSSALYMEQVHSLMLSTSAWPYVHQYMPSFQSLLHLTVLVDVPVASILPQITMRCPNLSRLTIEADCEFARVGVAELVRFVVEMISHPVALELVRVVVDGPVHALREACVSLTINM